MKIEMKAKTEIHSDMHTPFPLFSSHLDLAHHYWEKLLKPGDTVIDATCGNGKDTLKLAQILLPLGPGGKILGMDIQQEAIARTRQLLHTHLSLNEISQISLYEQSHAEFPPLPPASIRLIVYNLGYLPGSDKKIKTLKFSTLTSLSHALELTAPGGAISITCYPGHPEGEEEQEALVKMTSHLSPHCWNVCHHQRLNSPLSPSLLILQKIISN